MSKADALSRSASIGYRLRMYIDMNQLGVHEFAKLVGIPRRTVHAYLAGKSRPGTDHLTRMAELGIDINWLLMGGMRPQVTFGLSNVRGLEPVRSDILADVELSSTLMNEAAVLVDELIAERPELSGKMGLAGQVQSVWAVFANYASGFQANIDLIHKARLEGWQTRDLVGLVTNVLRDQKRRSLRESADEIMSGARVAGEPPEQTSGK